MQITPDDQKAILGLLEAGTEASTSKLAAISRTQWTIKTTALKAYATAEDFAELGQPSQYFFGAYGTAPGRVFLSYFTSRSSAMMTQAFLAGSRRGLQATPQMQEVAVAEVSNIVINAVAAAMADRCGMAFILSAPQSVRGARADIITAAFGALQPVGKIFSATITLASQDIAADCTLMMMLDDLIINFVLNALGR
jgi:chemotaxis protein CheY-P-specific phosphatase CheC